MQQVRAGLKAIYWASGWQIAADNNVAGGMYLINQFILLIQDLN